MHHEQLPAASVAGHDFSVMASCTPEPGAKIHLYSQVAFIRHSVPALKKETNTLWKQRPSRLEMRGKCKDSRLCLVIHERGGFSLSSCEPLVAAVGGVKSNPDFDFTRLRMFTYQDAMSGSLGYPPPKENRPL